MRGLYILFCLLIGAFCSFYVSEYAYNNSQAESIFVTVYSVLAGFLVAVIAVLGDPALLPSGNWQRAENHREAIEGRLIRHTWLFALYLMTIAVIFASALLRDAPEEMVSISVKHL